MPVLHFIGEKFYGILPGCFCSLWKIIGNESNTNMIYCEANGQFNATIALNIKENGGDWRII